MTWDYEYEIEHLLHAIYDAWKWLEDEAEVLGSEHHAGVSRAILKGQLERHQYPAYTHRLRLVEPDPEPPEAA